MRVLFVEQQCDYEPNGLMHMSTVLKRKGHQVELVISDLEDPVEVAKQYRPDFVGYSVMTGSQGWYYRLNRRIKDAIGETYFAAMGGPHPTFFPELMYQPESDGIDGVCLGEGEYPIIHMIDALANGDPVTSVPNWWVRVNGEVHRNEVADLIADLDDIGFPDRDLVYSKSKVLRESKIKHFIAARGCPYDCTYCFNHAYFDLYAGKGKKIRQRTVDHVIAEVLDVKSKYPLEFVVFLDDVFILLKPWLNEFAYKWPREVGLPFFCNVRANLVNPDLVETLREAGCASVGMGIEAGNDEIRKKVLKRHMSKDQIIKAVRLLRGAGIHVLSLNMVGLPGGSLDMDFETLKLNIDAGVSYSNVFIFQPYPGTELAEYAKELGVIEQTVDEIEESAWSRSILKFGSESEKRQIETFQRLFAITVEYPWLFPITRQLAKLPNNVLYYLAYKLFKGWMIKQRIHPHRLSMRQYGEMMLHFMRLY